MLHAVSRVCGAPRGESSSSRALTNKQSAVTILYQDFREPDRSPGGGIGTGTKLPKGFVN